MTILKTAARETSGRAEHLDMSFHDGDKEERWRSV